MTTYKVEYEHSAVDRLFIREAMLACRFMSLLSRSHNMLGHCAVARTVRRVRSRYSGKPFPERHLGLLQQPSPPLPYTRRYVLRVTDRSRIRFSYSNHS